MNWQPSSKPVSGPFLSHPEFKLFLSKESSFSLSRILGLNEGSICFPAIYTCVKLRKYLKEFLSYLSCSSHSPLPGFISLARNFLVICSESFCCENQALLNTSIIDSPKIILPTECNISMNIVFRLIFLKSINTTGECNIKYQ